MNSPASPTQALINGPQVSIRARDNGDAAPVTGRPGGFLLDLTTGAKSLTDSLEILTQMAAAAMSRATGAPIECGLVLHRSKQASAVVATAEPALHMLRLEQELGEGPITDAMAGGHPVAMNHGHNEFRWPQYLRQLEPAGFRSVLSVRLRLSEDAQSAVAFFAPEPRAFPLQAIADARSLAELAARSLTPVLELTKSRAAESDLRSALESRTSIDIACGVIMAQNRCSYSDAIGIISRASSHRNIKLRRVAEGILESLPGGPPRTHFEH
jgi:GAF domain-containing protein